MPQAPGAPEPPLSRALRLLLGTSSALLLSLALFGLPLAIAGAFRWWLVGPGTLLLAFVLLRTRGLDGWLRPTATPPLLALLAVLGVVTAWNLEHPSEHFGVNRDPGVYAVTGVWLAENGSLLLPAADPILERTPGVSSVGAGFYDTGRADGRLVPQFSHLTATVLAVAHWFAGPEGLIRANSIIGALGLLHLFGLAREKLDPWPSVFAVSLLAVSLPQLYVVRDTFSEPLGQFLVLAGTAELTRAATDRSHRQMAMAIMGTALTGALMTSRIDGVIVIAPLALCATLIARTTTKPRRNFWLLVAAGAVPILIGFIDLRLRSPQYLADLWRNTSQALTLGLLVLALAAVFVMADRPPSRLLASARTSRGVITLMSAGTVAVLGFLWLVRPVAQEAQLRRPNGLIPGLQNLEGVEVDALRSYGEESLLRLGWFVGQPTVLLAILGAALVTRELVSGREPGWTPIVLVLGAVTIVYLWRPSITPDQLWASRRYVPQALPLLALLAACTLNRISRLELPRVGRLQTATAWGAVVLLGIPFSYTLPLRAASTQRARITELKSLCEAVEPDAAVLLLSDSGPGSQLPQTITAFCGTPAATADWEPVDRFPGLAVRLLDNDRQLVFVTGPGADLSAIADEVARIPTQLQNLERTIQERPDAIDLSGSAYVIWSYRF